MSYHSVRAFSSVLDFREELASAVNGFTYKEGRATSPNAWGIRFRNTPIGTTPPSCEQVYPSGERMLVESSINRSVPEASPSVPSR